mmetsp:Transcript_39510/g.101416  ORF Transcript_39510/g.101416 Transcript_39510/m.101416 type:complete len:206 (+) Transcript_39510:844-1461(+)
MVLPNSPLCLLHSSAPLCLPMSSSARIIFAVFPSLLAISSFFSSSCRAFSTAAFAGGVNERRRAFKERSSRSSHSSSSIPSRRLPTSPTLLPNVHLRVYLAVTSTTSDEEIPTMRLSFLPHPFSYMRGASRAVSAGSACAHLPPPSPPFSLSLSYLPSYIYTSVQTWSVQSIASLASNPIATQHAVKQLAHSPHRPHFVSISLTG